MISKLKQLYWYIFGVVQSNLDYVYLDYFFERNLLNSIKKNILFQTGSDGNFLGKHFLIGTKGQGLLLHKQNGEVIQLLKGVDVYGITKRGTDYYCFITKNKFFGEIVKFSLEGDKITNSKIVIFGLSKGIHQIDFIEENTLMVTDTYNNRILTYDLSSTNKMINWRKYKKCLFPNGKLSIVKGRKSINYSHINSLYKHKNSIYLIAHNESFKTKKKSELFTITDEKIDKKEIQGESCHNFVIDGKGNELFCDSLNYKLVINNNEKMDFGYFTRGISCCDDFYLVGGSAIEKVREKRGEAGSAIFLLDKDYKELQQLHLPKCQVQEIRGINYKDYSYSNV